MAHFTREYLTFFRGLEKHNDKAWFEAHREQFEREVKAPFTELVDELLGRIRAEGVDLPQTPKDAIFRLHRDTRFAKDKSPYKTQMSAHLSPSGRKSHDAPGFYLAFGAQQVFLGGGAYMVDSAQLLKIRRAIVAEGAELDRLLAERSFKKLYGGLQGDKNKVLPAELKPHLAARPLLANKAFFYGANLDVETILEPRLAERLMRYWRAGRPVSEFFARAMA
jgi:uncharacterized protein (TIGR02453 family)